MLISSNTVDMYVCIKDITFKSHVEVQTNLMKQTITKDTLKSCKEK